MRIRSIRPEFWSSEDVAAMDWTTRLVYIGLWSYVDDNGVGRDLEPLIVADLFPLDGDLQEASRRVTGALLHLSERGHIVRYKVDGKPYLHVVKWTTHQRIEKASKGRYPLPTSDNAVIRGDSGSTPGVMPEMSPAGEGEKGRRGEGEKNTCSPATPSSERASGFEEFWSIYPRKVGKQKAKTKYQAACKRANADTIMSGAYRLANDPNLPEQQFIPHPTTWLERNGWDDEPLPSKGTGNKSTDRALAGWEAMSAGPPPFNPMWDTPILEEGDQ